MDRYEQGRTGLGGSDIAAIVGVSNWDTPLSTYLKIMGEKPPTPDNPAMKWGRKLEPLVLEQYAEREEEYVLGHNRDDNPVCFGPEGVSWPAEGEFRDTGLLKELRHPEHSWMMGHVDGLAYTPSHMEGEPLRRLVEAKTTGQRAGQGDWGEDGTDEIPVYYMTQVQWYLGLLAEITGRELPADVPVLFGDKHFRVYHIEFDRAIWDRLREEARDFWEGHVLPENPPPAEAGDSKALEVLYPRHEPGSEKGVEYGTDLYEMVRELKEIRDREDDLEEREDRIANRIKEQMGEVKRLTGPGFTINWTRTSDRVDVDWKGVVEDLREELRRWLKDELEAEEHDGLEAQADMVRIVQSLIDDLVESNEEIKYGYRRFYPRLKDMGDE